MIDSFLELSKTLRQLNDLPLEITSTQGTSSAFRYSALFPTLPHVQIGMKKSLISDEKSLYFKEIGTLQHTPLYVAPIEGWYDFKNNTIFCGLLINTLKFCTSSIIAVIQFSANNKWPNDLKAIRALQEAFYVELSTILQSDYNFVCRPHRNYVDVLKVNFNTIYIVLILFIEW